MKTTRESAREDNHRHIVHSLQVLLEKNYDAEKNYKKAIEKAHKEQLKEFFKKQGLRHNHYATELDKEIHSLNEHPVEKNSTMGDLHRAWIDIKTAIAGNKDEVLLEECLKGEKRSVEEYEERLKKNHFPTHIAALLKNQLNEMKETYSRVRTVSDLG